MIPTVISRFGMILTSLTLPRCGLLMRRLNLEIERGRSAPHSGSWRIWMIRREVPGDDARCSMTVPPPVYPDGPACRQAEPLDSS